MTRRRQGSTAAEVVDRIDYWNFGFQQVRQGGQTLYTIEPSDTLSLHGVYDTSKSAQPVEFGLPSDEEMLFNFLFVWPVSNLTSAQFGPMYRCGYASGQTLCNNQVLGANPGPLSDGLSTLAIAMQQPGPACTNTSSTTCALGNSESSSTTTEAPSCVVTAGDTTRSYANCKLLPFDTAYTIFWTRVAEDTLDLCFQVSTTASYAALAFATTADSMDGAKALIAARDTGMAQAYNLFIRGATLDATALDIQSSEVMADAGTITVFARLKGMANTPLNILYAVGPWANGQPDYHDARDSITVDFSASTFPTTTTAPTTPTTTASTTTTTTPTTTTSTTTTPTTTTTTTTSTCVVSAGQTTRAYTSCQTLPLSSPFTIYWTRVAETTLDLSFQVSTTSEYAALAFATTAGSMDGAKALIAARATGTVQPYTLFIRGATLDATALDIQSSDVVTDANTITVFARLTGLANTPLNVLYAVGPWTNGQPDYHDARDSITVDFSASTFPTTTTAPTTPTTTASTTTTTTPTTTTSTTTTPTTTTTTTTSTCVVSAGQTTRAYTSCQTLPLSSPYTIYWTRVAENTLDLCYQVSTTAGYAALGFASTPGSMGGAKALIASRTTSTVQAYTLFIRGATLDASALDIQSSNVVTDAGTITVFVRLGGMANTPLDIIYAVGPWNAGQPRNHGNSNRASASVDFSASAFPSTTATSTSTAPTTSTTTTIVATSTSTTTPPGVTTSSSTSTIPTTSTSTTTTTTTTSTSTCTVSAGQTTRAYASCQTLPLSTLSFTIYWTRVAETTIDLSFQVSTTSGYAALAFATTASSMDGAKALIAARATGTVQPYTLFIRGATLNATALDIQSSDVVMDTSTITVFARLNGLANTPLNVLYAVGPWTNGQPDYHDARDSITVDLSSTAFSTSTFAPATTTTTTASSSTSTSTSSSTRACTVSAGQTTREYASCSTLAFSSAYNIYWTRVAENTLDLCFQVSTTAGYAALGFASTPGSMGGAKALVAARATSSVQAYTLFIRGATLDTNALDIQSSEVLTTSTSITVFVRLGGIANSALNIVYATGPWSGQPGNHGGSNRRSASVDFSASSFPSSTPATGSTTSSRPSTTTTSTTPPRTTTTTPAASTTRPTCTLQVNNQAQSYGFCAKLALFSTPYEVFWTVLPGNVINLAFTVKTTDGFAALAFAATGGSMAGARALIASRSTARVHRYSLFSHGALADDSIFDIRSQSVFATASEITALVQLAGVSGDIVQQVIYTTGVWSNNAPRGHGLGVHGSGSLDLASGSVSSSSGNDNQLKRQVHGWLMAVGWGLLIPLGTFWPRFAKKWNPPAWFHLHRAFVVLGLVLTTAAFILGLVVADGLSDRTHGIVGVVVMSMGYAVVVLGLARPGLQSAWRPTWAVLHFWIARGAIVLAAINIFIGIDLLSPSPKGAYIASYALVLAALLLAFVLLSRARARVAGRSIYKLPETQSTGALPLFEMQQDALDLPDFSSETDI